MPSLVLMLVADHQSVRDAQDTVADFCAELGLGHVRDIAVLLTSEVVTNVVVHARTDFELRIATRGECLRVEVCDLDPRAPIARTAEARDLSGRGLGLLASLSGQWGVEVAGHGKSVWFELPV